MKITHYLYFPCFCSLLYPWAHARENNGLFNTHWDGKVKDDKKWLLTQAAFVEMYARLTGIK